MSKVLWILVLSVVFAAAKNEKKIVCYFGSWAVYRHGNGQITIPQIDPTLCTHLIYTFVGLSYDAGIKILDPYADLPDNWGKDGYGHFNRLRNINPKAKTLIAIGGWNEGSATYSKVVADPNKRETLAKNAVEFVKKYNFDGLDFDWEYPNQREGSNPADKKNFVLLLKELRMRFDEAGLLLSAAVGAAPHSASKSYIIPEVSKYLDFVNLMAYDFHGTWEKFTGINAPLYPGSWEKGEQRVLNVNASIHYWLKEGASPSKLVLGVPLYGRSFTLDNPKVNGVGAPASSPGNAGPYTNTPGTLGYNEICEKFIKEKWETRYEKEQRVPYSIKGNQWIGYENPRSLKEKAKFVKDLGLGGAMVWSVETDDFRGVCGEKYPLLKTLNRVLRDDWVEPATTTSTTQSTTSTSESSTETSTVVPGPCDGICRQTGFMRSSKDCAIYYMCAENGEKGYIRYDFVCPNGLVFDLKTKTCNWPYLVDCKDCQ